MFILEKNPEFYTFTDQKIKQKFWAGGAPQYKLPESARVAYCVERWTLKVVEEVPNLKFLCVDHKNRITEFHERLILHCEVLTDTRSKEYLEVFIYFLYF
jgi:hypothetical protein